MTEQLNILIRADFSVHFNSGSAPTMTSRNWMIDENLDRRSIVMGFHHGAFIVAGCHDNMVQYHQRKL